MAVAALAAATLHPAQHAIAEREGTTSRPLAALALAAAVPATVYAADMLERACKAGTLPVGDFRDWPEIEAWADAIAEELKEAETLAGAPS